MYSSPTILKETLYNGRKIPNVFYEMNPLREPNKRIDHFRVDFRSDSFVMNKTQSFFRKAKESAKTKPKKIKKEKNTKNKLYNSLYSKFFLRINFDRPREIRDELGVIISRHYKSLDINSKEYPDNIIRTFYFNKYPPPKKYIFNNKIINNNDCGNSNFFRTEIKIPINKNNKNIDADNDRKKKYNSFVNLNNKNFYEHYSSNNSIYTNNIDSKRFVYKDKFNFQGVPPLLVNSNNKNKDTTNGIKRPNNGINSTRNKFIFKHEEEKINKKWDNNIKQKNIVV